MPGPQPEGHAPNRARGSSPVELRSTRSRSHDTSPSQYDVPDNWSNLDEVAAPSPVQNVTEGAIYRHESIERTRSLERDLRASSLRSEGRGERPQPGGILESETKPTAGKAAQASRLVTQLYTLSYLVFFAIIGTLARLGLSALTDYPGAPVTFGVLWANFGGSLVMGFLVEDRMLFRRHDEAVNGGPRFADQTLTQAKNDQEAVPDPEATFDMAAAKKAHMAVKKTVPLYIGLATGFCGSFTSFSSFIADGFLAISNDLPTPGVPGTPTSRNGGYSFMAMLAVVLATVCISVSALFVGAHLAIALDPVTPSVRYHLLRRVLDPLAVFLGWGSWIGAVFLAIFPPHDVWRGRVVFSLVFAPLGCLARFYLSLYLNAKLPSFPLGTFCANMLGTAVLGMAWDIAHAPVGGVVGCQVLQGVEDGFCGCLTTVSTWVAELTGLRRRHAYVYGSASVVTALVLLIAIMGGLRWSDGFQGLLCST